MRKIRIPQAVIDDARAFFENAGSFGNEGTGMLAAASSDGVITVTKFIGPDQVATSAGHGCSVEVTDKGKLELAAALSGNETYVSRIHSHPGEAFHSGTDDRNPALTAEGAFSIVVPYFGLGLRHGLGACAIYVRRHGSWIELSLQEVSDSFEVEGG